MPDSQIVSLLKVFTPMKCYPLSFSFHQEFIEEILSSPFGGMIAFVKESEALTEKGQLDRLKNDEGEYSEKMQTLL